MLLQCTPSNKQYRLVQETNRTVQETNRIIHKTNLTGKVQKNYRQKCKQILKESKSVIKISQLIGK